MVAKQQSNNTARLFSLWSVLCFVASFWPAACEAVCIGMPCCERDEVTAQDLARGIPCCRPEAPLVINGLEAPKLSLVPPSVQVVKVVARVVFTVRWEPIRVTEGAVSVLPIYLKNQVFRC
jgi:hypothetical protein